MIVGGTDIGGLGESALAGFRRSAVGIVFQAFHLIPTHDGARERGASLGARHPRRPLWRGAGGAGDGRPSAIACSTIRASFRAASSSASRSPRAFVPQPDVLLADEPTGNLDGETGGAVMGELFRLRAERGSTLILVTHDHALAAQCDRMVHIADGQITAPAEG